MTIIHERIAEWVKTGVPLPYAELTALGYEGRRWRDDYEARYAERDAMIREFGFSIPCLEAIQAVASLSPLVEIGAGTGYWSAILAAHGADIVATDPNDGLYAFKVASVAPVALVRADAAVRAYPDRNVLCSWPSYNEEWCAEAVTKIRPGNRFALVGENEGGCTGTDKLFKVLRRSFVEEARIALPQFYGLHDELTIWKRKG